MNPSARIKTGIDIFNLMAERNIPMDSIIGDYMRQRRYIGSKDRAAIAERAYHMMRTHARLGWWTGHLSIDDTPRARMMIWLMLGENMGQQQIKDLFSGDKYAPEPLSEDELKIIEALKNQSLIHEKMGEAVQYECPPEHYETLRSLFGDAFNNEMAAMLEPATLDLRVNTFLCNREKAKAFLEADGIKTEETPFSPWGLRCENKAFLSRTKAWNKGWVEIQDEGSQLISLLCGAKPGMQVLDYCAGAGGKTLGLAAAMQRKGRIVAMDMDERRLMRGRERYKKAQLADIIELRPLSDEKARKWLKRQKEKFDVVLTDVPCSGTGTWRRNPDLRWRHFGPKLDEILQIQADIMDNVAGLVKPGGRFVYATCSLLPAENEHQVEAFLKRHDGWSISPVQIKGHDDSGQITGDYMRLSPLQSKTDGFFAAILQRAQ